MSKATISIDPRELEGLVRRVVREELMRLLRPEGKEYSETERHEGLEDPVEDDRLLREALAELQEYGDQPEAWMSWGEFEAELERAEAAGELPD